jgi:hypothetical protein
MDPSNPISPQTNTPPTENPTPPAPVTAQPAPEVQPTTPVGLATTVSPVVSAAEPTPATTPPTDATAAASEATQIVDTQPAPTASPVTTPAPATSATPSAIPAAPAVSPSPQPTPPAAVAPTMAATPEKKGRFTLRTKIIIAVIVLVLLVAGGIAGFMYQSSQKTKQAARTKIDTITSYLKDKNLDPNTVKDAVFNDMGYNEKETDPTKLREIIEVGIIFGFTPEVINRGGALNEKETTFSKNDHGHMTATRHYELKWEKLPKAMNLTITVDKEGKDWQLAAISTDPKISDLLSGSNASSNELDFGSLFQ